MLGAIPLVSDGVKLLGAGAVLNRAISRGLDAVRAAEAAGDQRTALDGVELIGEGVAANRRRLEAAEATGDPDLIESAQDDLAQSLDAYQEALAAAERACFVAGTLILTPTGLRAIEALKVGETVLAGDPTTGAVKECRILQTFVREVSQVFEVQVGDESIECSAEHPFWVVEQGWTHANKLQVGDALVTSDGQVVRVEAVRSRAETVNVYNFEVEHLHTYFVSDLGILVHNTCKGTLERGDINRNIVGGVPSGYEGHHLISVKVAEDFPVMQHAANTLGYNINRANNGIALPGTPEESLATGLPYHGGRHNSRYNNTIRQRLAALQDAYDMGLVDDSDLIDEITRIEDGIRDDLLNNRLRLQNNDPRP